MAFKSSLKYSNGPALWKMFLSALGVSHVILVSGLHDSDSIMLAFGSFL